MSEAQDQSGDVAAVWDIKLADGVHKIVFEHGTTSGKRVISVDGEEVLRKNWMFRLVGSENFKIGKRHAEITITSLGLSFEYVLTIDGKSLKKFVEVQAKNNRVWLPRIGAGRSEHRIVLEIETMEVYVDGQRVETVGEFTENGCETHFNVAEHNAYIKAVSSGHQIKGLIHSLVVEDREFEPVKEC